ncbi:hypothetical protein GCWU000325_01048 [Alloprevotella tannerae ATCC 51259]|uniref:Uncharacterized protein n=1 Tax=Alloprevotella tannerae ATCC 51259 TaxID=626522 RepID=C9LFR0_9BACT|nr:hypothetical protein GCWU000325_01048 [Alloprevotella tannerae ATCC 51259]
MPAPAGKAFRKRKIDTKGKGEEMRFSSPLPLMLTSQDRTNLV